LGNLDVEYSAYSNVLEILHFISKKIEPQDFYLHYACGEITVSPYCNEILELWKQHNWEGAVLTNAAIYDNKIADLLQYGKIKLNCSLDAGTAETYSKIKGVNCFDKTVENLTKYAATGGVIELKYIFLKDVNDNVTEIKQFLDIAAKLNANVVISRNSYDVSLPLSKQEELLLLFFVSTASDYGLKISHEFSTWVTRADDILFLDYLIYVMFAPKKVR
jgi:sulfatase maturation enzyme AslB (radical SAM superfamily)